MAFGASTTTDEVLDGVDLTGKIALVTGASGGIGKETARALAAHGAQVILAARDAAKCAAAIADITAAHPEAKVEAATVDLANLASIRSFTDAFLAAHQELNLLIANAGVMAAPFGRTADGFETQFGTNHLGHFVLVNRLVPALLAGAPSRVVVVSSAGHHSADVDLDDPNFERTEYDKFTSYSQSKTANVLYAVELDRRLADRGVRAYALHPGGIATDLGRHMQAGDIEVMIERATHRSASSASSGASGGGSGGFQLKSIPAGAATSVFAATSPSLEGKGGIYLEDCHETKVQEGDRSTGVRAYALDPARAAQLWSLSETLVGETFPI